MSLDTNAYFALTQFVQQARSFSVSLENARNAMAAGDVNLRVIEGVLSQLVQTRNDIIDLKARPGIGDLARRIFGASTANIGTALDALQTIVETAGANLRASLPLDAQNYVLAYTLNPTPTALSQFVPRMIPPAQTATLRTDINAVVAAVEALFAELQAA